MIKLNKENKIIKVSIREMKNIETLMMFNQRILIDINKNYLDLPWY